jgi:hypothetical protein
MARTVAVHCVPRRGAAALSSGQIEGKPDSWGRVGGGAGYTRAIWVVKTEENDAFC